MSLLRKSAPLLAFPLAFSLYTSAFSADPPQPGTRNQEQGTLGTAEPPQPGTRNQEQGTPGPAEQPGTNASSTSAFSLQPSAFASDPLVDISKVAPTIVIDLRYATARNITHHPIYPPGTPCLIRASVAARLENAQQYLLARGFRLKIWDAYRPSYAQRILWDAIQNQKVIGDPNGRSLHSWGIAVDVTLTDLKGNDVPMPTDFDDFTPAARDIYKGPDPIIARNFAHLRHAMHRAGFYGITNEWWHYMPADWQTYTPITPADLPPPEPTPHRSWWPFH